MLIARNDPKVRDEARRLLQAALHRGTLLPDQLFRWHIALAKAALDMGDRETQQRAARTALRLAGDETPTFSRYPTVGVVHADQATIAWLEDLAAGRGSGRSTEAQARRWWRRR